MYTAVGLRHASTLKLQGLYLSSWCCCAANSPGVLCLRSNICIFGPVPHLSSRGPAQWQVLLHATMVAPGALHATMATPWSSVQLAPRLLCALRTVSLQGLVPAGRWLLHLHVPWDCSCSCCVTCCACEGKVCVDVQPALEQNCVQPCAGVHTEHVQRLATVPCGLCRAVVVLGFNLGLLLSIVGSQLGKLVL